MALYTLKYPLDTTGVKPENRVINEPHTLMARRVRALAPKHGPFYTDPTMLILRDALTQTVLVKDVDYYCTEYYEIPSKLYGKEICAVILITNETVSSQVELSYQVVGGEFSYSSDAIVQMIAALNLDDRPVNWPSLLNRPQAFTPAPHLHDIGDVYGFEYITQALERIRDAILMGDAASHDEILRYVDAAIAATGAIIDQLRTYTENHVNNKSNPHEVTPTQLNVFTKPEVNTLLASLEQTLTTALNALDAALTAHKADKENPHATTAAQVGAYTKAQVDAILSGQYVAKIGDTMTGALRFGSIPLAMTAGNSTNNGSLTCFSSGAGDGALAGMTFHNAAYAMKMGVRNDGIFGIGGWSSPAWRWYSAPNGDMIASGDVYAYSDPRLKENIEPLEGELGRVLAMRAVSFDWRKDTGVITRDGEHDLGFLADNIQGLYPEAVTESLEVEGVKYKTVAYQKLVAPLTAAIQELYQIVVESQHRITQLEQRLSATH